MPYLMLTSCVSFSLAALVLLISAPAVAARDPPMTIGLPGCETSCGNVRVPYPFGIGPDRCYWPGFKLTCDHGSKPPRLLLDDGGTGGFEVVDISLKNTTMRIVSHGLQAINMSGGIGRWSLGGTVGGVLYFLQEGANEFILAGCNVQATLAGNGRLVSGCSSFCTAAHDDNDDDSGGGSITYVRGKGPKSNPCSNIGCCQSSIVGDSVSFRVDIRRLSHSLPNYNVLIAEVGWLGSDHNLGVVMDLTNEERRKADQLRVPVILNWAVAHDEPVYQFSEFACPDDAARSICKSTNSQCRDARYLKDRGTYSCRCKDGYEGNPYLTAGCQMSKSAIRKKIMAASATVRNCQDRFGAGARKETHGNSMIPGGCVQSADTNRGLIIGLSVASGPFFLLLVLGVLLITRGFKRRKAKALRLKFFTQNRGQLLKQLVSHRADIAERMLISLEDLEKATNNFDQARRLGCGGHGTVYKGILSDLHVVAIKKSNIVVRREIDEFINEVAILSQIYHRNIVKLRGCCLETEVPLLAYEFISNGTLNDHLHTEEPRSLPWKERLRIASEIGKALAYLHSAVSIPVIHRDIKPSNILLDDALTVKVSDFGASRYVRVDQTGTTTAVQGTIGYLDPMYYYNGNLTESSDVYSFGVLLVELLTRRKPSFYRSIKGDGLVMEFCTLLAEGNLSKVLDPQVVEDGGIKVEEVATLVVSCVKLRAEERPTMRQVEMALETLQAPNKHVMGDSIEERDEKKHMATNYPSTSKQPKGSEASRCYSQEEEVLLSATYP